jgi:hypothetical protein
MAGSAMTSSAMADAGFGHLRPEGEGSELRLGISESESGEEQVQGSDTCTASEVPWLPVKAEGIR